ncbi:MAG: hypothetical protein WCA35_08405 [Kovacikia sp.]
MVNKKHLDVDRDGQFDSPSKLSTDTAWCQPLFNRDYADADILRLAAFFRDNPNPILVFTPVGDIVKVNPPAERLLRRLPIPATELLPENHRQIVQACLAGQLKEHGVEVSINNHVFALTYHPLPSFGMVYLYVIEITDYRRAEADLLQVAANTVALAKLAISQLQAFRTTLPKPAQRRRPADAFADLFVAMDGCVFSASPGQKER